MVNNKILHRIVCRAASELKLSVSTKWDGSAALYTTNSAEIATEAVKLTLSQGFLGREQKYCNVLCDSKWGH